MKAIIAGAALAVGTVLSLAAGTASASCQGTCNTAYRQCVAQGNPDCKEILTSCLDFCKGESNVAEAERARTHIKDQNGQEILIGRTRPVSLLPLDSKT